MKVFALFSGGLDSIIAAVHMRKIGFEVLPVNFKTPFFTPKNAMKAAEENGFRLIVFDITDKYLEMLQNPRYGYGKYLNPCIDCHGMMLRTAGERMEEYGVDFIVSGEVLGQRPMSQLRNSLQAVSKLSNVRDLIVRPLSQKLLEDTKPIRENWVKKEDLLDIQGRGRTRQMQLAEEYGIKNYASPGGGCILTEKVFSRRLQDLIKHDMFDLQNILFLKDGRHFRLDDQTKFIVGRHKRDNDNLAYFIKDEIVIKTKFITGPLGILITKKSNKEIVELAARILLRYNKKADEKSLVSYGHNNQLENDIEVTKIKDCDIDQYRI